MPETTEDRVTEYVNLRFSGDTFSSYTTPSGMVVYTFGSAPYERWIDVDGDGNWDYGTKDVGFGQTLRFFNDGGWRNSSGEIVEEVEPAHGARTEPDFKGDLALDFESGFAPGFIGGSAPDTFVSVTNFGGGRLALLKYVGWAGIAGASLLITGAAARGQWALGDNVAVPVVTLAGSSDESIIVCMYPGARPEPYRIVAKSCKGGASECTAFVALPRGTAEMIVTGYDLSDPPREATGPECTRPEFISEGTLRPRS